MFEIGDYRMRIINETDLERLLTWRNSEHVRSKMFTDHIITMDEHRAWFKSIKNRSVAANFIFEFDNRPIGYICYTDIDTRSATCSSGLYLGEQEGLPVDVGLAIEFFILEYAVEKLQMRKLWGYVFEFNKRVIMLHKFFGYRQEGFLSEHILKNGKYENLVLMSLFADDWKMKREHIRKYIFKL
ncbi:UDP-4-amino-4,6-dideoxy-N-acetyl-beta-L-altrosamine N-acetyltransferase [Desulfosporosinus sp. FKA]|uniref:UDP-4-amino-4, 6-dideoxy-N-acetyl-beta-L-altrosamine N-acetyltransferase n=1 Tax=Desulfosporosinus sp. FKA TaxID=1969834 RepID=UPI001553DDD7|nr:UDP-4-amino-4,6-dideoxy-N-acetyl-beta-L-altrosamine N-acetyltransferase [Desulfosporosinus sp. FKA]